ncbi:MAG: ribosome-associated toxin RatA of RatAB toxin-antitoxin module [Saprospiraceae bacterium]|jgi:ribosome-associated toxin RatA of RatAB toxin-antitoxin module
MYTINRSALVAFSDQQMYDLINDIDSYQLFLPWCGGSNIIERMHTEKGDDHIIGSVTIAFKGVNKTFTTKNTPTPFNEIRMELVDGPFSELTGSWQFKALNESACKVSLNLEFGFANRIVGAVIGPIFSKIADSMVESFCERAQVIYGE